MMDALQRLRGLAAGLCHESGVGLETTEGAWAFDPERRNILVPEEALRDMGPEGCAGVLAHEVGHIALSRYHLFRPGPPSPGAFRLLANHFEDARVEAWMRRRYPGVEAWLERAHGRDVQNLLTVLPAQCYFVQFAAASLLLTSTPGKPPEEVRAAVAPAVRQALDQTADARRRYVFDYLPPLVPNYVRGCECEVAAYERDVAAVEGLTDPITSQWERLVRVLAHRAHKTLLQDILPTALSLWSNDVGRVGSLLSRRSDLERRLEERGQEERHRLAREIVEASARESGEEGALAPSTRRLARRVIALDLGERLQARETGLAESVREDGSPRRPACRPRRPVSRRRGDGARETWEAAWRAVQDQAQVLVRRLEQVLRARRCEGFRGAQMTGSRVDMRALVASEADVRRSRRVWARRTAAGKRATAFLLLLDLSGSMRGARIRAATRATVLLTEVLAKLRVPFAVMGFQDVLIPCIRFGEALGARGRERIAILQQEVFGLRPGGNNQPSYNDDGPCLQDAAELLLRQCSSQRVLVVISDGRPEGSRSDSDDLRRAIRWADSRGIRLVGLGLGDGTDHVETFYRHARGNIEVGELAGVVGNLVERVVRA